MYDHVVGKSILLLIIQVGNTSNLILDPDLDSCYTMDTVITKMPELVQLIRRANARATGLILTRENSESKKQLIAFILARIDPASETIDNRLQRAVNENSSLPGKLSFPIRTTHIEAVQAFDDIIRRQAFGRRAKQLRKTRSKVRQRERIDHP